jgi:hypothetical protein
MWNDDKSIVLSQLCVTVFIILLIATAVSAPWLIRLLVNSRSISSDSESYFLLTVYSGAVAAAFLLGSLFRLLHRIKHDEVFISGNVESLRHISWCSFAGAVICGISAFYYVPWVAVAVSAAFMGLIVRVVKNILARAVSLQDDANYTI